MTWFGKASGHRTPCRSTTDDEDVSRERCSVGGHGANSLPGDRAVFGRRMAERDTGRAVLLAGGEASEAGNRRWADRIDDNHVVTDRELFGFAEIDQVEFA